MIYGSVCSGIEAASVAWHPLGWQAAWLSEIEEFPNQVLKCRWPDIPNLGDMTKIHENKIFRESQIDLLVGGTPCQSFSVAGLRKGLDDTRGNLCLEFLRLVDIKRPRWFIWENVPGVLSSSGGRDFGSFLGALAKLGYGFAYRILDAQYFGVPQRRRRVFVVGYLGDWRPAAAVLFEPESLSGHIKKSREKRKGTSASVEGSIVGSLAARDYKGVGNQYVAEGNEFPLRTFDRQSTGEYGTDTVDATVSARDYKSASDLITIGFNWQENHSFRAEEEEVTNPLRVQQTEAVMTVVSIHENQRAEISLNSTTGALKVAGGKPGQGYPAVAIGFSGELVADNNKICPLDAGSRSGGGQPSMVLHHKMSVRRLTPKECERLQGFPDDYTLLFTNGKKVADGPRYKALGNSMAVPVMHWIGRRIQLFEDVLGELFFG